MSPARLRVLHVIDSLSRGGAERLLLTSVRHLDHGRYEHRVAALFPPLSLRGDFEALAVPVHAIEVRGPWDVARGVARLARLMRRWRPDVVHTHLLYANSLGRMAAMLAGVPHVVTTIHALEHPRWSRGTIRGRVRRLVDAAVARRVNARFVAVSRAVSDDCRRHAGGARVEVIHNYIDTSEFTALAPAAVEEGRRAFGWNAGDAVIVQVGRIDWEKGQMVLVRALPRIAREVPHVKLLLVGDGPQLPELRRLAASLGVAERMQCTGLRPSVRPYLGMADLFVFPSICEGFGIAVLEAMAMGLPIVAARTGGITEILTDERDALLVPPDDPDALAAAVVRLLSDPQLGRRLSGRAAEAVHARFSADVGVRALDGLYSSLSRMPAAS